MASYPTPSAYQEAVQFPESAFLDETLQDATPRTNVLGLPQPISGAFAVVFPMTDAHNQRWAAKCFLTDVPDQQARYEAIAAHLSKHDLPALVTFDYQQPGIRVEGTAYPLLKMEWVEGTALNTWVRTHRDDPDALQRLATAWISLLADLEAAQIAHGDLQHGNVLVVDTDSGPALRLVDYDTMYVPALDGRPSPEVGHRNYQHPDRTERDFGPALDRFAGLVIYTAIQATRGRPALWDRFDTGENLLFRDSDFYEPEQSALFQVLRDTEAIAPLVAHLETACYQSPEQVPALAQVRDGTAKVSARSREESASTRRTERSVARTAPRTAWTRLALPLLVAGLVLAAGLGGTVNVWGGVGLGAAVAIGWGAVAAYRYRTHPIVRRQRRLQHEVDRYTALIETMERELKTLAEQKSDVKSSVEARRAERLEEVQDEALYDKLKHHFIGEVGAVDGVKHRDVVRLKANNIRTAYEATPKALADVRRIHDTTKARINMWRSSLKQNYADALPETLSPAEERRLQRYIARRVERIETEAARVREKIRVYEAERRRTRARQEEQPALSIGRYLMHLLYWTDLPKSDPGPPRPSATATDGHAPAAPSPDRPAPVSEGPWWRQGAN
jgi:hypothetical protein